MLGSVVLGMRLLTNNLAAAHACTRRFVRFALRLRAWRGSDSWEGGHDKFVAVVVVVNVVKELVLMIYSEFNKLASLDKHFEYETLLKQTAISTLPLRDAAHFVASPRAAYSFLLPLPPLPRPLSAG
jgi:hypothetical protein